MEQFEKKEIGYSTPVSPPFSFSFLTYIPPIPFHVLYLYVSSCCASLYTKSTHYYYCCMITEPKEKKRKKKLAIYNSFFPYI